MPSHLKKLYQDKKNEHKDTHDATKKQELLEQIKTLKQDIQSWSLQSASAQGFDWFLEFFEVFADGGFDVVIANPPYGIKCPDPLRFNYFPNRTGEEKQSKDSYGLFMARAIQLLKPGGFFSFIVSDTWRTIKTHRPLRKKLVNDATVHHVLDLPPWVFEATVNTCILSLSNKPPQEEHTLIAGDLRNLPTDDWKGLEDNLQAVAAHGPDIQTLTCARYTYPQNLISTYNNLSFFIGSPSLYRIMSDDRFTRLDDIAEVKQGLASADNEYYLRKNPGTRGSYQLIDETKLLSEEQIKNLSDDEKRNGIDPEKYGGRHFLPYDKGGESDAEKGWLPNYHVPTQYFIDWSRSAVYRLKTATIAEVKRRKGLLNKIRPSDNNTRAAVIRNPGLYFKVGLSFSRTGFYSPTFRFNSASIFDPDGSCIFTKNILPGCLIAVLTSPLTRYMLKNYIGHTIHTEVEELKLFPLLEPTEKQVSPLIMLVNVIVEKQKANPRYPYHLKEQKEIDKLVYELYDLTELDIQEIELWYCRRYPKLAEAQGVIAEVKEKYTDHLTRCEYILSKPPKYWKSHPILQLIAQGEGQKLEFKETLEADIRTGTNTPGLIKEALKTIAGFLNADGGTLLIGVSDSGEIKGLDRDFPFCHNNNRDGFQLKLRSLLGSSRFNPNPLGKINILFEELAEGTVCRIDVPPLPKSEIQHFDNEVYVRDGNQTPRLEGLNLTHWVTERTKAANPIA
jgi:hypothetical protein